MSGDGKTIVFEHDFGIWKLDIASRRSSRIPLEIAAETQEDLTEFRDFNSTVDDYDLAPDGKRIVFTVHGELFTAPTDEAASSASSPKAPPATSTSSIPPTASRSRSSPTRAAARRSTSSPPTAPARPRRVTDLDTLKTVVAWSPDSKSIAFMTSDRKLYTISRRRQEPQGAAPRSSTARSVGRPGRPTAS